jgi:hypothetical protein
MRVNVGLQMRSTNMIEMHLTLFESNQGIHAGRQQFPTLAVVAIEAKVIHRWINERIIQHIIGIYFLKIRETIIAQRLILLTKQKVKSSYDE